MGEEILSPRIVVAGQERETKIYANERTPGSFFYTPIFFFATEKDDPESPIRLLTNSLAQGKVTLTVEICTIFPGMKDRLAEQCRAETSNMLADVKMDLAVQGKKGDPWRALSRVQGSALNHISLQSLEIEDISGEGVGFKLLQRGVYRGTGYDRIPLTTVVESKDLERVVKSLKGGNCELQITYTYDAKSIERNLIEIDMRSIRDTRAVQDAQGTGTSVFDQVKNGKTIISRSQNLALNKSIMEELRITKRIERLSKESLDRLNGSMDLVLGRRSGDLILEFGRLAAEQQNLLDYDTIRPAELTADKIKNVAERVASFLSNKSQNTFHFNNEAEANWCGYGGKAQSTLDYNRAEMEERSREGNLNFDLSNDVWVPKGFRVNRIDRSELESSREIVSEEVFVTRSVTSQKLSINGGVKRYADSGDVMCPSCRGKGSYACPVCKGLGSTACSGCLGKGFVLLSRKETVLKETPCGHCQGKGHTVTERREGISNFVTEVPCAWCNHFGFVLGVGSEDRFTLQPCTNQCRGGVLICKGEAGHNCVDGKVWCDKCLGRGRVPAGSL